MKELIEIGLNIVIIAVALIGAHIIFVSVIDVICYILNESSKKKRR